MFADWLTTDDPPATSLPTELCEQYYADGLVHLNSVFTSDEVTNLLQITRGVASVGDAPSEHLADGFRSWRAVTTVSAELAGLACDPRLTAVAVQLLGPSIRLVGTQLIHRHPFRGVRTARTPERPGWHRDIYGMNADLGFWAPPCAVKCAIWLTDDNALDQGATRFLPGSHRHGIPVIPSGEFDPPGWTTPPVRAGDVTVFENRTAHAGGFNTSEAVSEFLLVQFGYRWLAAVANRLHPDYLIRSSTHLARQLLEPDDCDEEGCYRPGSGAAVIAAWVSKQGLRRYAHPPTVAMH